MRLLQAFLLTIRKFHVYFPTSLIQDILLFFSEEGGGVDEAAETVIDIVDSFKLSETSLTKKDFTTYIKGYLKRVLDHLQKTNPDRVEGFKAESAKLVKKILENFDDFQFFMSESNDFEASIVYAYYKDEETAPRFLYFKDGLVEEKY